MPGLHVDFDAVQSNILYFGTDFPAQALVDALKGSGVLVLATGPRTIRACMHHQVDEAMLDRAIEAFGREVGVIAGGAA